MSKRIPLIVAFVSLAVGGIFLGSQLSDSQPSSLPANVQAQPLKIDVASLVCLSEGLKAYDIPGGKCVLYPDCPTGRLSIATIDQDGRYPEQGQRVNATCTEAILVLEGQLTVRLKDTPHTLKSGDVVYITPKTPYSVEGKAKAVVMVEPKWDKTQNTPAP